jgi:hypothetical protein
MGERKVINKYIPADFDPSLVPKGKKLSSKDGTVPVRMMLPFSIQCDCGEFLYRGRKFNSKKEAMGGPEGTYLGITRWRFYIKCTSCARPLTFLTDPENADYEMESGGTRNFEMKHDVQPEKEKEEDEDDPMKALENRVLDSQREMADLDNLEEIKAMNARHVQLLKQQAEQGMAPLPEKADEWETKDLLTEEDEQLVKSIKFGQSIKRLDEEDEAKLEEQRQRQAMEALRANSVSKEKPKPSLPVVIKKRKRVDDTDAKKETNGDQKATINSNSNGLASLLGDYGSDSDSD